MKLFWKIYLSSVIPSFVIICAFIYITGLYELSDERNHLIETNKLAVRLVSNEIKKGHIESKWPFISLKELSRREDFLFWWIVRDDGTIHLANDTSFIGTNSYKYFSQAQQIHGVEKSYVYEKGNRAVFVNSFGEKGWSFWLGCSLKNLAVLQKQIIKLLAFVLLTMAGGLAIVIFCAVRYFTNPINELAEGAAIIGKGNLSYRVKTNSKDEIGQLAESFNNMAEDLAKSTTSIVNLNTANRQLQSEISVRKQAEQKLAKSELRYRSLTDDVLDSSSVGIFILDSDFKIVWVNKSLELFFGIRKEDIIGKDKRKLIRERFKDIFEDLQEFVKKVFATYENNSYIENFECHVLAAGSRKERWLEHWSQPIGSGLYKGGRIEHYTDITERKRANEAIRQSEEKYRLLSERVPVVVYAALPDESSTNLFVSGRVEELTGYKAEEVLADADLWGNIIHPDDHEYVWTTIHEHRRSKSELDVEYRIITRSSEVRWIRDSAVPMLDESGEIAQIAGFMEDITERKQAEQKQAELLKEVESINEELKDFAYIASHDLKAPLRGIKTLAEWIRDDYTDKLDENGKEQLDLLSNRTQKMHNLIDGILEYSRVGRIKEKVVQVDVNKLLSEIIDMLSPPESISIEIENELPVIECEHTRIMQVFQNLIGNAVKYMDKPDGQIRIGNEQEDGFWKFYVSDNGPGIEEKDFERIFKIFQKGAVEQAESTGVGLTVVKKIIEMYGGRIWVESQTGQGSTFMFTFPKAKVRIENEKLQTNTAG